ncbi:MAG: aminoacyl-tRNA hydrolase [Opitutaceae bacterium]
MGNPGREYRDTRHNLGWQVLDALATRERLAWRPAPQFRAEVARWDRPGAPTCWLVKPQTFMNASGEAVGPLSRYHRIPAPEIVAVYDDLTLDLGLMKVSIGGGSAGHNGVASLVQHLDGPFVRFRLGIGPRAPAAMELTDFVLGTFTSDQSILVSQRLPHFLQGLDLLLTRGADAAMNQLNRRDPK